MGGRSFNYVEPLIPEAINRAPDLSFWLFKPEKSIEERLSEIEQRLDDLDGKNKPLLIEIPTKEEIKKYGKEGE